MQLQSNAVRWVNGGSPEVLGDLPGGANGSSSAGSGKSISDDGTVIIGTGASSNAQAEAFRWTAQDGMVGLGTLLPGGFRSTGVAVSGDGTTVTGHAETLTSGVAMRWTASEGMVALTSFPAGVNSSSATALSRDGSVIVGRISKVDGRQEAFRWSTDTGVVGLGYLSPNDLHSDALLVSPDGKVIFGSTTDRISNVRAFRWTAESGMQPFDGPVQAMSSDGRVMVGGGPSGARVWIEGSGTTELKELLKHHGVEVGNWQLSDARGVSADGKTIVGYGFGLYGEGAFIATIPEPSTWLLIGSGFVTALFFHGLRR